MPQYIDELCKNFADHLPEKSKSTPIPEHTILGLKEPDYAPSVEEQIEFRDKGYLVAAGSILWVARQAYPEIMFTACQLATTKFWVCTGACGVWVLYLPEGFGSVRFGSVQFGSVGV